MKNQYKIAICTFARSDYGLMKRLIRLCDGITDTWLIVGGDHLSDEKGRTVDEIWSDPPVPADKILVTGRATWATDSATLTASVASGMEAVSNVLRKQHFDALVVMGDRHELFTATIPSLFHHTPLVHISGGEVTEGAIDDSIRHATTKMAHLHLVANRQCAENISRMGEEDWRIVVTGEPGIDQIHHAEVSTKDEVKGHWGIDLDDPLLLVTLHPCTLELKMSVEEQCMPLVEALRELASYRVIVTAPGAEEGSGIIMMAMQRLAGEASHVTYIPHLGSRSYLAVLKHATAVVGNSSSGLVEAPSLGTPCVNIGNRQKNRMASEAIIHCGYDKGEIISAVELAATEAHRRWCSLAENPYDPWRDGENSRRAVKAISAFLALPDLPLKLVKTFDTTVKPEQWNTLLK